MTRDEWKFEVWLWRNDPHYRRLALSVIGSFGMVALMIAWMLSGWYPGK